MYPKTRYNFTNKSFSFYYDNNVTAWPGRNAHGVFRLAKRETRAANAN